MNTVDVTRENGILNPENREFVLRRWGEGGSAPRNRRYRIRQKFIHGVRDLYYLTQLPGDEQEKVISEALQEPMSGEADADEGSDLLMDILQLLYNGLGGAVFEIYLQTAIEEARLEKAASKGEYPQVDVDVTVDEDHPVDLERTKQQIENFDGEGVPYGVTEHAVEGLYRAGEIAPDEYEHYREHAMRVDGDASARRESSIASEEKALEAAQVWRQYNEGWSINDVALLCSEGFLSREEAEYILNGTDDHDGFRYAVHCLTCAHENSDYDGEVWESYPVAGPALENPKQFKIKRGLLDEELREWHQTQANRKQLNELHSSGVEPPTVDRCTAFENPEVAHGITDIDFLLAKHSQPLTYSTEPEHDPEDLPQRDDLTPSYIEELHERGIISRGRYLELLYEKYDLSAHQLSDEQRRSLYAEGMIDATEAGQALDPEEMDDGEIDDLLEDGIVTEKRYLDMLEMKYRIHPGKVSYDHLRDLVDDGRVDPSEAAPTAHFHLLKAEIHTPEEFLDALEAAYERSPDEFGQDDLLELYDGGRVTAEEVVDHPNTAFENVGEVSKSDSVVEMYPDDHGRE